MTRIQMSTPEGGRVSFEVAGVTGFESVPEGTRVLLSPEARLSPVRGKFTVEVGIDLMPVAVVVAEKDRTVLKDLIGSAREG